MKYTKIDDTTIEIEDEPPKRTVNIKVLKAQKEALQAQKAQIQAAIDKLTEDIQEAKKIGVE